jgi:hypothetical protein
VVLRSFALALILWALSLSASAACSGSGQTWTCTAGSTVANVNSAISSGSDGMTITFEGGSYSWSTAMSFSNTKGMTLKCAAGATCNVTVGGTVFGLQGTCSGTNNRLYRISGFSFNGGGSLTNFLGWWYGACTATRIVIDNNSFTNFGANPNYFAFGETSTVANFYGVIYRNTFTNNSNGLIAHFYGAQQTTPPAQTAGSSSAMFIEDNTLTFSNMTNTGQGCVDGWGGNSIVFRYNTVTNCRFVMHGVVHDGGPWLAEVYRNTFICSNGLADCYRAIHHQGSGEFIAFDNVMTASSGKSSSALAVLHYRSATPAAAGYSAYQRCNGSSTNPVDGGGTFGYPCWRQPGRDGNGNLKPMYFWNNRWSDTGARIGLSVDNPWGATSPSVDDHIAANRDFYEAPSASAQTSATSPFNGASGMGFGTASRRPTTCTTGATGGGVGYWATDEGRWNGFAGGAQGRLYRCSATNTWTLHYTPYTYPHPLRVQGGLAAPTVN